LIGLPEQKPDALIADKGDDSNAIRTDLKSRAIKPVISPRLSRVTKIRWIKRLYKLRNRIERTFGLLKINRAIATRYDKLANSFLGMLNLAIARMWLKYVHSAWLVETAAAIRIPDRPAATAAKRLHRAILARSRIHKRDSWTSWSVIQASKLWELERCATI
jgi:transposase